MKRAKGKLSIILAVIMALTLLAGCTPQKKLMPPKPDTVPPDFVPKTEVKPTPQRSPAQNRDIAADIADQVANLPGVKSAYAVVVGNAALIGINLDANKQEKGISEVKNQVAEKAEADPRIVRAYVSTDPDTTARIREIANDVKKGRPMTDYLDEIGEIIQRLAPKTD